MTPEVQSAVNDILYGSSVNNHTEWLQREYVRLMRRECAYLQQHKNESKLSQPLDATKNDGPSQKDWSAEQHRSADNQPSFDGNTDNID